MSTLCLHNGHIITGDPNLPEAHWLRIEAGCVAAVGYGSPDSTDTNSIDLQGRRVVPGFCDAHVHLTWIALSLMGPALSHTTTVAELLAEVDAWDGPGRGPEQSWLVGDGFDETTWTNQQLPTRQELDTLRWDGPVLVKRVCGHVAVGNSIALQQLPEGSYTNKQTGRIAESDLWALNDRLRPDAAAFYDIWPRVRTCLHEHGITAVHDVASLQMVHALERLEQESQLGVRISYSVPSAHLAELRIMERATSVAARGTASSQASLAAEGDSWLRFLGLKIFTDGSLGARTAHLRQAYADASDTCGASLLDRSELQRLCREGHERGWQLMVHAIGDVALDEALQALQPLCGQGNPLRHRLEHVEVTPPDLVKRLAASGAWACVQPNFAQRWSRPGGMNEKRLGAARLQDCNAYRTLQEAGVPLAFGSDCMPLGPLYGLQAAVHHPLEAQRLAPSEALRLYTAAAAELCFREAESGVLRPGLAADLAILEGDPYDSSGVAKVVGTVVDGRLVWKGPAFPC